MSTRQLLRVVVFSASLFFFLSLDETRDPSSCPSKVTVRSILDTLGKCWMWAMRPLLTIFSDWPSAIHVRAFGRSLGLFSSSITILSSSSDSFWTCWHSLFWCKVRCDVTRLSPTWPFSLFPMVYCRWFASPSGCAPSIYKVNSRTISGRVDSIVSAWTFSRISVSSLWFVWTSIEHGLSREINLGQSTLSQPSGKLPWPNRWSHSSSVLIILTGWWNSVIKVGDLFRKGSKSSRFISVNDGFVEITICNVVLNQTNPAYYYFITSINPLFELIIVFCLPLLINIICTSIIVRSLRVRMRRAKRFTPLQQIINESRRQQQQQTVSSGTRAFLLSICSWFAPQTVDRANIYSCFCFQIQCQRHRRFRFHITRKKHTFVKHQDDNESIDRQPADAPNQGLTANFQQITGTTSSILKRKHQIRRTRDKHLSAMLIVLNILYFLLNLPFNFHQTFGTALYQSPSDGCIERFTHVLLDILQQTYFSTNFFLYVLTNRRFREELHTTFRKLVTRDSSSLLETQQRQRQNSGNVNPSTVILAHQQHYEDYQTIPLHRDSCLSEIELSELPIIHSQQILVSSNERDQCISKLVLFERPHWATVSFHFEEKTCVTIVAHYTDVGLVV